MRDALVTALVVLHVVTALVGFGFVALSGVYAGTARRVDRGDARAEAARFFATRGGADWAVVALPAPGLAAAVLEGQATAAWVAVALGLWAVAAALVVTVVHPGRRALRTQLAAPDRPADPPGRRDLRATATRTARAAAVIDVVFVLAVLDMVYRPGH